MLYHTGGIKAPSRTHAAGYNDPSGFSDQFKALFGLAPTQYKIMIRCARYRGTIAEARTKQEAKDAEAAVRREIFEGTYGKPKGDGSFIEYAEQVFLPWSKSNKRSWKADERNVEVLKNYFQGKSFRDVTPMLIEKFKKTRWKTPTRDDRQRSGASINRELACNASRRNTRDAMVLD